MAKVEETSLYARVRKGTAKGIRNSLRKCILKCHFREMDRDVLRTSIACEAIIIMFCNILRFSRLLCICACNCKALFVSAKRSEKLMKSRSGHKREAVDAVVMCNLSLPWRRHMMHTEFGGCLECVETGFLTSVFRHCRRGGDDSVCSERSKVMLGSGCSEGGVLIETPQTHLSYFTHCLCLCVCVCPLV